MPNRTVYFPQKLLTEYETLANEMSEDAQGLSVSSQKGLKREVARLKSLKKLRQAPPPFPKVAGHIVRTAMEMD